VTKSRKTGIKDKRQKLKDKRQKLRNPALRGKLRDEIPQNGNKRQKTKDKWQMANGKRIQFFNLF